MLLKNIGFNSVEVLTPGKLDIDILYNSKSVLNDRFWSYFLEQNEEIKQSLQNLISSSGLSSHMLTIVQKE